MSLKFRDNNEKQHVVHTVRAIRPCNLTGCHEVEIEDRSRHFILDEVLDRADPAWRSRVKNRPVLSVTKPGTIRLSSLQP